MTFEIKSTTNMNYQTFLNAAPRFPQGRSDSRSSGGKRFGIRARKRNLFSGEEATLRVIIQFFAKERQVHRQQAILAWSAYDNRQRIKIIHRL